GTAAQISWNEKRLGRIDLAIAVNERRERFDVSVDDLQFQSRVEKPADIRSARLSFLGQPPHWQSAAAVRFRDGSSVEAAGTLIEASPSWRFAWERLTATFPSGGSWTSQRPGSLSWKPGGRTEIRHLSLADGPQSFEVPLAVLDRNFCQV